MNNSKVILQKLKSKAKLKGMSFQLVLQLFCQEEFLRRLEKSKFRDLLILKGGLFLFSYSDFESRPTMDIDFLAQNLSNDKEEMKKIIEKICEVDTGNNYIDFVVKSIEDIAEMKAYHGVRLKMVASIANTKTPFDIDIGIGDIIVPKAHEIKIPTQLNGFATPCVVSYSLESTIAEKLEAMFDRMEMTSRMKDYYDIFYLASHYDFDSCLLIEAIDKTFSNRGTVCNVNSLKRISNMYQDLNMVNRWNIFVKKSLVISLDFKAVNDLITTFIDPLVHAIEEDKTFHKIWSSNQSHYSDI